MPNVATANEAITGPRSLGTVLFWFATSLFIARLTFQILSLIKTQQERSFRARADK
jgi:tellurite resistance protein TehA-like permease